jgi:hypothetical protein
MDDRVRPITVRDLRKRHVGRLVKTIDKIYGFVPPFAYEPFDVGDVFVFLDIARDKRASGWFEIVALSRSGVMRLNCTNEMLELLFEAMD